MTIDREWLRSLGQSRLSIVGCRFSTHAVYQYLGLAAADIAHGQLPSAVAAIELIESLRFQGLAGLCMTRLASLGL